MRGFFFPGSYLSPCSNYLWGMVTYYCISLEEALRWAKLAGKQPGCYYGGITPRSGKKGFAVFREGKVIKQYSAKKSLAEKDEC